MKKSRLWQGRLILLLSAHVVGTSGYFSILAMAPIIRSDLHINASHFGFLVSAFFGAQMLLALPAGNFTDHLGVNRSLGLAMLGLFIGTIGFILSDRLEIALFSMFVMGLGYSLVNPATGKGVMDWFPKQRRATAMGIKQLGVPLGGLIAAGAGVAAELVEWRVILIAVSTASLVTGLICFGLKATEEKRRIRRRPLEDIVTVIANRKLCVINGAVISFNIGQASLFTYLTLFVRDVAMASQPVAAMCLFLAQGASAAGRLGFSYLSDTFFRGGRKTIIVLVVIAAIISTIIAVFVGPEWNNLSLFLLAVLMGGTIAAHAAIIISATVECVEPQLAGSAIGYGAVSWSFGGMIGPPIFGYVLDVSESYAISWLAVSAILMLGLILFVTMYDENSAD